MGMCCLALSLRSKHFCTSLSRKSRREQNKGNDGGEGGREKMLAGKPHNFEKLRSPMNTASDWCGAGGVD